MGSMAAEDVTSSSSVVLKSEPIQEGYTPSSISSNDDLDQDLLIEAGPSEPVPVIKRKGGRKPIYATSEERKQRNRQAQAAFRERRTEYIKQLEKTIQHHEETLQTLQQSHRTAADECLMLRYKNSLLERILLEKGIDVQAELRLKSSPHLRPIRQGAAVTSQASAMQKAMMNRQQQQRQRAAVPPIQPVPTTSADMRNFSASPTAQHALSSQQASPQSLRSPAFQLQSPASDVSVQHQQQQPQAQHTRPNHAPMQNHPYATQPRSHVRNASSTASSHQYSPVQRQPSGTQSMQQNFYPTPFQKHYDQLDQEFDAPIDMLEDGETDDIDADSFIPNFRLPPSNNTNGIGMAMGMQASPPTTSSGISEAGTHQTPYDYDPMLDADPFGLSASMHFPNQFTFPASIGRR